MDDLWGGELDFEVSVLHSHITTQLLELLGFVINKDKTILSPIQILDDNRGFIINSQEMSLSLPVKKILKIQQACKNLLQKKTVSVRELSKVLGQLVATARAVFQAPLHYKKLQMSQIWTLLKNQRWYNAKLDMSTARRRLKSSWSLLGTFAHPIMANIMVMNGWLRAFLFHAIGHPIPEIKLFQALTLKLKGQGHGCGQRARSYNRPSIISTHFFFISHQLDQQFLR